jgi:hypothetical protein
MDAVTNMNMMVMSPVVRVDSAGDYEGKSEPGD